MQIQLSPDLEQQIQEDIDRGPFRSATEFVEYAVRLLHEQESWLAANRDEIAGKIQAGWDAAQRGELTDESAVRSRMEERKADWGRQQRSA
jgi:antitoxin ParD1/3/4